MRYAMLGINAAVVGLLMSAFYHPVWTSGILSIKDFALALIAFLALTFLKAPSWAVVIACAAIGAVAF
ncbi:Chromate transporter [compost metagenome]